MLILEEIEALPDALPSRDKIDGLSLVATLLGNVCREPQNEKFRTVKKSNATIRRKLRLDDPDTSFANILIAVGFEYREEEQVYTLPMSYSMDEAHNNEQLLKAIAVSIPAPPEPASASTSPPPVVASASLAPSAPPYVSEADRDTSSPFKDHQPGDGDGVKRNPLKSSAKTKQPELERQKLADDLELIRAERARQFAEAQGAGTGSRPCPSSSMPDSCGRSSGTGTESRGGFFSTLWNGNSSNGGPSRRANKGKGGMMSINDLPKQARGGG